MSYEEAQEYGMNRLLVSFSGGRTSGYMTWRILQEWRDRYDDIVVLFANTGCEHEKTLEFIHNCDRHFGFNTVWLEAVVHPEDGKGVTHKVVTYETASRNGEPFAASIAKYGIPNAATPVCTDRLKTSPMRSYVRDVLGMKKRNYHQCVGIRVDEIDRVSAEADKHCVQYPLIRWGVDATMVRDWWAAQEFDLELRDELDGNCVWCWKKSDRKLLTIAKRTPEHFDFPMAMERLHPVRVVDGVEYPRTFFRNNLSTKDIIARSREPFTPWSPTAAQQQIGLFSLDEMDISNGCSESCEVEYI